MDKNIINKEIRKFLKDTAKQRNCNIALTIQPNSRMNSLEGIKERMGKVEDIINKNFFPRRKTRYKVFYIATIEENYHLGYHLHLAMHIPEKSKDWFIRKIESIVKHNNNFPASSIKVKEIYDVEGWMGYITKDLFLDNTNFFLIRCLINIKYKGGKNGKYCI